MTAAPSIPQSEPRLNDPSPDQLPRWAAAIQFLYDTFSPDHNPFLGMEMRREGRNWKVWAGLAAIPALQGLGLVGLVAGMTLTSPGQHLMARYQLPLGDLGLSMVAAIHLIGLSAGVTARAQMAFWFEQDKKTIGGIVLAPMSPVELVIKKSAYPFVRGLLVGIAGVPAYALCAAMGGGNLLTFAFLVLLILLMSVQIPMRPPTLLTEQQHRMIKRHQGLGASGPFIGVFGGMSGLLPNLLRSPAVRQALPYWLSSLAACSITLYPFFALHWPPIALALPVILLHKAAQVLYTASHLTLIPELKLARDWKEFRTALQQARTDVTLRSAMLRGASYRLWTAMGILLCLGTIGYLWQRVASGWAGWMFNRSGSLPHALTALLALLTVPVVLTYAFPVHRGLKDNVTTSSSRALVPGTNEVLRHFPLSRLLLGSVAIFLFCCLLGRTPPWQMDGALFFQLAAISASAVLYKFSLHKVEQVQWQRQGCPENLALGNRPLSLLPLISFPYPILALIVPHPLVNATAALSPGFAFFNLTPWAQKLAEQTQKVQSLVVLQPPPPWWMALAMQIPFALACLALAAYMRRRPEMKKETRVEVPWIDGLIESFLSRFLQRWDNAVTTREVRVRMRRSGLVAFSSVFFCYTLIWLLVCFWPQAFAGLPAALPQAFVTPGIAGMPAVGAALVIVLLPVVLFMSLMFAAGTLSYGYTSELRKGTWQGVALTPMRDRDIAAGKLMPALLSSLAVFVLASPFLLLGVLLSRDVSVLRLVIIGAAWVVIQTFLIGCLGTLAEVWHWLVKWIPVVGIIVIFALHLAFWFAVIGQGVTAMTTYLLVEVVLGICAFQLLVARVAGLRSGDIQMEGTVGN